jgi:hypothetical protein
MKCLTAESAENAEGFTKIFFTAESAENAEDFTKNFYRRERRERRGFQNFLCELCVLCGEECFKISAISASSAVRRIPTCR